MKIHFCNVLRCLFFNNLNSYTGVFYNFLSTRRICLIKLKNLTATRVTILTLSNNTFDDSVSTVSLPARSYCIDNVVEVGEMLSFLITV